MDVTHILPLLLGRHEPMSWRSAATWYRCAVVPGSDGSGVSFRAIALQGIGIAVAVQVVSSQTARSTVAAPKNAGTSIGIGKDQDAAAADTGINIAGGHQGHVANLGTADAARGNGPRTVNLPTYVAGAVFAGIDGSLQLRKGGRCCTPGDVINLAGGERCAFGDEGDSLDTSCQGEII